MCLVWWGGGGSRFVELIYDTKYHTQKVKKGEMSWIKTKTFSYPCVDYVSIKSGKKRKCYAKCDLGHFGQPKVMFSVYQNVGKIIVDRTGKYGLTEQMAGIVDVPENLDAIAAAMTSEKFKQVMRAVQFNTRLYNRHVIKLFRKDFWKDFV